MAKRKKDQPWTHIRSGFEVWEGDVEMVAGGVLVQTKGEDIGSLYTPGIVGYEFWKAEALRRKQAS